MVSVMHSKHIDIGMAALPGYGMKACGKITFGHHCSIAGIGKGNSFFAVIYKESHCLVNTGISALYCADLPLGIPLFRAAGTKLQKISDQGI